MGFVQRLRDFFTGQPEKTISKVQLVTETGNSFYAWDGKLYKSDIIRACIRPKVQAIGKIVGKHIRETVDREGVKQLSVNPSVNIKYLLEEPNPYMTGQMLQEKLATQLCLNGNAFAVISRDEAGAPNGIYPLPATTAEALYLKDGTLCIRFALLNGRSLTLAYSDLIHIRRDFYDNDIFGERQVDALSGVMEVVGTIDQSIIKAVKNSGIIKWLLSFNSSLRPEDLKKNVKEFVDNYLSIESETFGAAGVDSKCEAKQITPTDYVPDSNLSEQQINRIYAYFNTNENIVKSSYTEEQWNSYYENEIEPVVVQFSNVWTQRLFTHRERAHGNQIIFEASNLQFASMATKLRLVDFFDRGIMNQNEIRATMSLPPIPGGDEYYIRLDTASVKEREKKNNG